MTQLHDEQKIKLLNLQTSRFISLIESYQLKYFQNNKSTKDSTQVTSNQGSRRKNKSNIKETKVTDKMKQGRQGRRCQLHEESHNFILIAKF